MRPINFSTLLLIVTIAIGFAINFIIGALGGFIFFFSGVFSYFAGAYFGQKDTIKKIVEHNPNININFGELLQD